MPGWPIDNKWINQLFCEADRGYLTEIQNEQ